MLDLSISDEREEGEDSAVAIALPARARGPGDSSEELDLGRSLAVVAIESAAERRVVAAALAALDVAVVGQDLVQDAALVVVDARPDVRAQLAGLRKIARPDAAIVLVGAASAEAVREAHAAGAAACLRAPVVAEELASVVRMVHGERATRERVADLEQRLDLEAHLASIGRISAGLAHEVSGPLLTATMNVEALEQHVRSLVATLRESMTADPADGVRWRVRVLRELADLEAIGLGEALVGARAAHDRLRAIVSLMRGFMQREQAAPEAVDLRAALGEVRALVAAELAGVHVEVIDSPATALADRGLLLQILQNLCANAAHAAKTLSSPQVRLHSYTSGDRAIVSVRDNGPGIEPELQARIFEPFFTTRRGAGGTGLGLALCREYARRMGAELALWSVPGRGACFRVIMPRAR